jgi:hypothetical protein
MEFLKDFDPDNTRKRRQEETTLQPQIDIGTINGSVGQHHQLCKHEKLQFFNEISAKTQNHGC